MVAWYPRTALGEGRPWLRFRAAADQPLGAELVDQAAKVVALGHLPERVFDVGTFGERGEDALGLGGGVELDADVDRVAVDDGAHPGGRVVADQQVPAGDR